MKPAARPPSIPPPNKPPGRAADDAWPAVAGVPGRAWLAGCVMVRSIGRAAFGAVAVGAGVE